ncbi:hypothetical protein CYY_003236 [Polysphondylium violaceum]|uniref:Purple acid phosphatase n=1 Tax=Polysphondylium violaceum TaxID=133409 RepID=A0A8J4PXZ8_9MYCE|nr:hypothetical protein CYY_003236 [Polysphondylium violaceum]
MNKYIGALFIILISVCVAVDLTPYGIKLALTKEPQNIKVTWLTNDKGDTPTVLYSRASFTPDESSSNEFYPIHSNAGAVESFPSLVGYWNGNANQAVMANLTAYTTYFYYVGDREANQWSQMFNFSTRGFGRSDYASIAVYGDMGHGGVGIDRDENYTLSHIMERQGYFDFVLHLGDIAYADITKGSHIFGNQTVWDEFLGVIQPVATILPYMVCPGNHDVFFNLDVYRKTFYMPTDKEDDSWYSFDYAGAHFVGFSSEHDYIPLSTQYNWLENNLKHYREKNPNGWLIVYSHRPFYCSSKYQWCEDFDVFKLMFVSSLEKLLMKYNVDIYLAGHSHTYERTLPVYDNKVLGTFQNPKATVHITIGSGGNKEGPTYNWLEAPEWSNGLRSSHTGFGKFTILNSTTIQWDFVDNYSDSIVDSFVVTKGYF